MVIGKKDLFPRVGPYESNNLKKNKNKLISLFTQEGQYYHFWLLVGFVQSGRVLGLEARGTGFDPRQEGKDFSFYFF